MTASTLPAFPSSVFHLGGALGVPFDHDKAASPPAPAATESTRVQLALDYVSSHGTTTPADLARAMGLPSAKTLKAYLKVPLRDGRLQSVDGGYALGTGEPVAPPPKRKPAARKPRTPAEGCAHDPKAVTAPIAGQIATAGVIVTARTDGSLSITAKNDAVMLNPRQTQVLLALLSFTTLLSQEARHG